MASSVPVPTDFNKYLYTSLAEADPEVAKIVEDETWRQFSGLELIASEVSLAASRQLGSYRLADSLVPCVHPELNLFGRHGGQRFHAHQQVL